MTNKTSGYTLEYYYIHCNNIKHQNRLTNGYFEYDYIQSIFKLRKKNIGKKRGITYRR